MDFKKWQYEEKQKAKESRKKSSSISIKEMKYRPKIGMGDFDTKTRKVAEFLNDGHKVKVTIMFRGREVFHPELGAKILDQIAVAVNEIGKVEAHARLDGRNMTMVLAPDRKSHPTPKPRESRPRPSVEAPVSTNGTPEAAGVEPAVAAEIPTPVPAAEVTAPVVEQPESDTNPA
jgi:translation initiation factor IF-3